MILESIDQVAFETQCSESTLQLQVHLYKELYAEMKQIEAKLKKSRDTILELTDYPEETIVEGLKIQKVKRKGSIDYALIVKEHAAAVDLEDYRKAGSVSWKFTPTLEEDNE